MNYKKFIKSFWFAFNLTGVGLITKNYVFDIRHVTNSSFEPTIASDSYILISKFDKPQISNFLFYFSPNEQKSKLTYQIAGPGEWVENKVEKYLMKTSGNNIAVDSYTDHSPHWINESFVEGRAFFILSNFQFLGKKYTERIIQKDRFEIGPYQQQMSDDHDSY